MKAEFDTNCEGCELSDAELDATAGGSRLMAYGILTAVTALTGNVGLGLMAEGTYAAYKNGLI